MRLKFNIEKINSLINYLESLKQKDIGTVGELYSDLENNNFTDDEVDILIEIISICK